MTEPPHDSPADENDRGTGLMYVILVAGVLMCLGSGGVATYFAWRAARNAAEREDEEHAATVKAFQPILDSGEVRHRMKLIATGVADGLKDPNRLADSYDKDGKPLLSWRVHLLPRIGENDLYRRFNLNEPWDGPTNKPLIEAIPQVYDTPSNHPNRVQGSTFIRGMSFPGAVFEERAQFRFDDQQLKKQKILAVFDSGEQSEWTRPDAIRWPVGAAKPPLGGTVPDFSRFNVITASGEVIPIPRTIPDDLLRQMFDRAHDPKWDDVFSNFMDSN